MLRLSVVFVVIVSLVGAEYDYMSDMVWMGRFRGCESRQVAGELAISCSLKSGNLTITVNRAASWLQIICDEKSSFSCSELEESRSHIADYITVNQRTNRRIFSLDIDRCILPRESLVCLLDLVNANSTELMRFLNFKGHIVDENLVGLNGVVKFRITGVDKNTTKVPYPALSKLQTLNSFTMKGGSLILDRGNETLTQLKTLELVAGDLKVVPSEAFIRTPNIQTLMLWDNKINHVDEDAFKGLKNLTNVSLSSNNISRLPSTLFSFSPFTRRIDLYDNRLEVLQGTLLKGLIYLEEVIIFGNKAYLVLEDTFSHLLSLRNLKLETSNLKHLPDSLLRNSSALKTLSFKGNQLKTLPPSIFYDQKLIELNLSNNKINKLPVGVFNNQTKLKMLYLNRNMLKDLSGGLFFSAKSLDVLDLSDNEIELLSRNSFSGAENLRELNLAGNRIHYVESATFDVIKLLQILSLSRNNLTIPTTQDILKTKSPDEYVISNFECYSSLKSLINLKTLNLSHNKVSIICEDWKQMYYLKNLDLSYNNISYLSGTSIIFNSSNITVDVRYNRITNFILANTQNKPPKAPSFLLGGNPFKCDCYLYEFIQRFTSQKYMTFLQLDDAKCASPSFLNQTLLSQLSPKVLSCDIPCDNCSCLIRPHNRRFELDCPRLPNKLPDVPKLFKTLKYSNQIRLRSSTDYLPTYYKYVDMSNLNLSVPPSVESSMEINLVNNTIKYAPFELFENNCTVYLSNNPFECTCKDLANVEMLQKFKHFIRDYNNTICRDGALVSNINIKLLCMARNATIVGSSIALVCILSIIITVIAYKYSIEIGILIDKFSPLTVKIYDNKKYDGFVSYAHQDEEFVVEKLLPKLEGGRRPLKLCVHYRNWIIGDFIPAQIARSVDESRKTIVVLSKHFINSIWGHMEFRTAHGKRRVIILMLDELTPEEENNLDPELKAYIAMNTYVKASDPLVFDKIRGAVLTKNEFKETLSTGLNV